MSSLPLLGMTSFSFSYIAASWILLNHGHRKVNVYVHFYNSYQLAVELVVVFLVRRDVTSNVISPSFPVRSTPVSSLALTEPVMRSSTKTNEVQNKNPDIAKIKLDTSIVAQRSALPLIRGYYPSTSSDSPLNNAEQSAYPAASIYYACNADADPSLHWANFTESPAIQAHFQPPSSDSYSEEEARNRYLESKPVCYMVLGKPGLETEKLAEEIALARKCPLISASKILKQIEEGDEEKRLECGCGERENLVWNRIVDRLSDADVAHRGYVLEGLPLIQNEAETIVGEENIAGTNSKESLETVKKEDSYVLLCMSESGSSIDSVLTEKLSKSEADASRSLSSILNDPPSMSETSTEESKICICTCAAEPSDEDKKCPNCKVSFQIGEIFSGKFMKPDIIIHITCPDDEILAKNRKPVPCDSISSVENISGLKDSQIDISTDSSTKSICEMEHGSTCSEKNLKNELQNYAKYASKTVENLVIRHNPQNVICLDGRYPLDHILETIKLRLRILPIQTVLVPEKIFPDLDPDTSGEFESGRSLDEHGELESDSLEDFEDSDSNLERVFDELKRRSTPSDKFEWKLSRWKFLCPVELAKGRRVEGRKKLAVRFMSWLFFLSSSEAMEAFIENPRPYLLPPNPKPCCRIAVIGPRYSGKTKLSLDLAENLDSLVIDVRDIAAKFELGTDALDDWSEFDADKGTNFEIDQIVNEIVGKIESSSEQNCGSYLRDRGYILDSVYLDYEFCKKLVENDVPIDTVIVLFESDPFEILKSRWLEQNKNQLSESENMEENEETFEDSFEESPTPDPLNNFVQRLRIFNRNMEKFVNQLVALGIRAFTCDIGSLEDLSSHAISLIRRDYQLPTKILEVQNDEDRPESDEFPSSMLSSTDNQIKYSEAGDCSDYCPVALMQHKVLWRGKDEYRCILDDKVYSLSSEQCLNDFIFDHSKFGIPMFRPLEKIPPLRVFIVGPIGSGKSTLSNLLSRQYGLAHIDFYSQFDEFMQNRDIDLDSLYSNLINDDDEEEDESNDSLEGFEFPDDPDHIDYSNDKLTISKFFFIYKKQGASLPTAMANQLFLRYYKSPFDECGLVVDSFPNCIEDCEMILDKFAIPDIIIELKCDRIHCVDRSIERMMTKWKEKRDEEMKEEDARFKLEMEDYLEKKQCWIECEKVKLYRERKAEMYEYEEAPSRESSMGSMESFETSHMSDFSMLVTPEDEQELEERFRELFPEPVSTKTWESEESARERFISYIENEYEKDMLNMTHMFNFFANESIPWVEVDARLPIDEIFLKVLYTLSPYFQRNPSLFEKVHQVNEETAERLLASGYYFLSSFGRFCPIQLYNEQNPFQMFIPLSSQGKVVPVLHRQYVYFLGSVEALKSFRADPLKFLVGQDHQVPLIPTLISVIGPPKCGKSTLAQRLSSTYELESVTRDELLHYVMTNFPRSLLSNRLRVSFQSGEPSPSVLEFARATKLFLSNPRCVAQGCVFDGFPADVEEYEAFRSLCIAPIVIVDLDAPLDFTLECLENSEDFFLACAGHQSDFEAWCVDKNLYRRFLGDNFANVAKIDATMSKVAVWRRADEAISSKVSSFSRYVRQVGYKVPLDLEHLCVAPREIGDRASRFQLYCPSCIALDEIFHNLDPRKCRQGLTQFCESFYWFCDKHLDDFYKRAETRLKLFEKIELPERFPQVIKDQVDLGNQCWASRLLFEGKCIVHYVDNLPRRRIIPGLTKLAVLLGDSLYLFDSETCRDSFLEHFPKYTSYRIHYPRILEAAEHLDLKNLPDQAYLEQTLGPLVAQAVSRVGALRPKLPGLSAMDSAAIFMGAFLKANAVNSKESNGYQEAVTRIVARCELFRETVEVMKERTSPWVKNRVPSEEKLITLDDLMGKPRNVVEESEEEECGSVKFKPPLITQLALDCGFLRSEQKLV